MAIFCMGRSCACQRDSVIGHIVVGRDDLGAPIDGVAVRLNGKAGYGNRSVSNFKRRGACAFGKACNDGNTAYNAADKYYEFTNDVVLNDISKSL